MAGRTQRWRRVRVGIVAATAAGVVVLPGWLDSADAGATDVKPCSLLFHSDSCGDSLEAEVKSATGTVGGGVSPTCGKVAPQSVCRVLMTAYYDTTGQAAYRTGRAVGGAEYIVDEVVPDPRRP